MFRQLVSALLCASILCGGCSTFGSSNMDTFVVDMKADLATVDFVYQEIVSWYKANPSIVGTDLLKTLEEIQPKYEKTKKAINAILDAYTSARRAEVIEAYRNLLTFVTLVIEIAMKVGGPAIKISLPSNTRLRFPETRLAVMTVG